MSRFKIGGAVIVPLLLLGSARAQSISFDPGVPTGNKGDMTASGQWSKPGGSLFVRVRYHVKDSGGTDTIVDTTATIVLNSGTWKSSPVTFANGTYTYWADLVYSTKGGNLQVSTPQTQIIITNSIVPPRPKFKRRRQLPVD